jgi:hypothetical protein
MDPDDITSLCRKPLAHFGHELMDSARDWNIGEWDAIVEGTIKAPSALLIHEEIKRLGPDAQDFVKRLIPEIVDTTLHYVMFMFEHPTHHGIRISVTLPDGETCPDLNAVSDGLAGDLISWIEAFSKKRSKTFPKAKIVVPDLPDLGDDGD